MKFFVYILESLIDGTFYIGQTNDLAARLKKHNGGLIKSTKSKRPFKVGYFEIFDSRTVAMRREWEIKKKYNTERRKKLIRSFDNNKLINYLGL